MRERLSDYQEEYGDLYNLEATPAESTTYRLAKHDKQQLSRISSRPANRGIRPTTPTAPTCRWTIRRIFSTRWISRTNCRRCTPREPCSTRSWEKSFPTGKRPPTLVRTIAENYKLPYYTMSPTYSICKDHGYLVGEQYHLPGLRETGRRFTAASPATTVRCRTGTRERPRSTRTVQTYDIAKLCDEEGHAGDCEAGEGGGAGKDCGTAPTGLYLFTTKTCPNCRIAKEFLKGQELPGHRRGGKSGAQRPVRHHAGADAGDGEKRRDHQVRERLQHPQICGGEKSLNL